MINIHSSHYFFFYFWFKKFVIYLKINYISLFCLNLERVRFPDRFPSSLITLGLREANGFYIQDTNLL